MTSSFKIVVSRTHTRAHTVILSMSQSPTHMLSSHDEGVGYHDVSVVLSPSVAAPIAMTTVSGQEVLSEPDTQT